MMILFSMVWNRKPICKKNRHRGQFINAIGCLLILLLISCSPNPSPTPIIARQARIPTNAPKGKPEDDILPPQLHVDDFSPLIALPGEVNTAGGEDSPFITPDGNTLYFFFTPDISIPAEKQLSDGVTGIYQAHNIAGAWRQVERVILQTPGKLALDGCPFVLEEVLWFCSAREGYDGVNHFSARWIQGTWQEVRFAGAQFPPEFQVGELHFSADGQVLYFHSPRPGGKGGLDLWLSRWSQDGWSAPENLATLNTEADEGWPFLTQDGQQIWFTRTIGGAPAILRANKRNEEWSTPELVLSQFAGEPTLDTQGNLYFVHHYVTPDGPYEADIYVAYRNR
jgi:hypothetical protein